MAKILKRKTKAKAEVKEVPCEPCRSTGLKDGAADAQAVCDNCEGSGLVKE